MAFKLTEAERLSPLWLKLLRHCEERLHALRVSNDVPTKDERETALVRGQILAFKSLIALNTDRPDMKQ